MKFPKIFATIIIVFVFFIGCNKNKNSSLNFYSPENKLFTYYGRFEILQDNSVALISSASLVEFIVEGNSLNIKLKSANNTHNYIAISINEQYQKRYKINSDSITNISIYLSKNQQNKIQIFKATEAASGAVIFHGVEAQKVISVPKKKKRTIEFIGDSVTCGAAADPSYVPCGEGEYLDQHNAYLAYGPRIAKALNVNFMLSSVSGIGIYRNWNDENIEEPIMPEVYENLYLNKDNSKKYDFLIKPEIVSICLGTNDLSNGDGIKPRLPFNKEKFVANYIDFVKTIFKRYPNTKIVLLNSPMITGEINDLLISCLEKVQNYFAKDNRSILIFELEKAYNNGCTTHPNIDDHKDIADTLTPFYKNILK